MGISCSYAFLFCLWAIFELFKWLIHASQMISKPRVHNDKHKINWTSVVNVVTILHASLKCQGTIWKVATVLLLV